MLQGCNALLVCYCYVPLLVLCIYAMYLLPRSTGLPVVWDLLPICQWLSCQSSYWCYSTCYGNTGSNAVTCYYVPCYMYCVAAVVYYWILHALVLLVLASYVSVTGWSGDVLRGLWICLLSWICYPSASVWSQYSSYCYLLWTLMLLVVLYCIALPIGILHTPCIVLHYW